MVEAMGGQPARAKKREVRCEREVVWSESQEIEHDRACTTTSAASRVESRSRARGRVCVCACACRGAVARFSVRALGDGWSTWSGVTRKLKRENTLRRRGDIGGVMSSENGDSPAAGSMRAKMVEKFVEALGDEEPNAASIAAGIESEVHTRFSGQGYAAKGRSLIFNLKKNGDLRARVLSGDYAVDALVTASASELAVEALKKQRQASLDRYVAQVCRHPLCRRSLAQCLPSRDVLAQVLILQFPTFLEQRSLSGDEQVVGWAAGTSGKVCVARPFPRCMPLISSNLGGGLTHAICAMLVSAGLVSQI